MTMRATGLISGFRCSSNIACFGLIEYKGRREICAPYSIVAPQTSKTRQHRRYNAAQQTNVRSRQAAAQRWVVQSAEQYSATVAAALWFRGRLKSRPLWPFHLMGGLGMSPQVGTSCIVRRLRNGLQRRVGRCGLS